MMKTDHEIRPEGMRLLLKGLGEVNAERFIALMNREKFDYTLWRQKQWQHETVHSLAEQARELRRLSQN
jgi:hypothetical protein